MHTVRMYSPCGVFRCSYSTILVLQVRPIVAGFKSLRDKENILRHCTSSKVLKTQAIYVTEDFSAKRSRKLDQAGSRHKMCFKFKHGGFYIFNTISAYECV